MSLPSQKELQEQLEKLSVNLKAASNKGEKIKSFLQEGQDDPTKNKNLLKAEIQILQLQLAKIEEEIQQKIETEEKS